MPAEHFRNARARLRLPKAVLARRADVSVPTLLRIEDDATHFAVKRSTREKVRQALEQAGARFGDDGALEHSNADARSPADPFAITAARFHRARLLTGAAPRDLIRLTGLTHPTLKAVERGSALPQVSRETVLKIIEAYRVIGYCFCTDPDADCLVRPAGIAVADFLRGGSA